MELRNRETGAVLTEKEFRKELCCVSLPKKLTDETVDPFGYDIVRAASPAAVTTYSPYSRIVRDGVVEIEGEWYENYEVITITDPDEIAAIDKSAGDQVRYERDRRLQETDWTQLNDVVAPEGYTEYRQELRDVTDQEGFPHAVVWPEKP